MISLIIDLLFPSRCAACGSPVSCRERHLCAACAAGISPIAGGCPICSAPLEGGPCPVCGERQWYLDRHVSVSEYRGVMKKALQGLKFLKMRDLSAALGELAAEQLAGSGISPDTVTWVPMNSKKRWERGFNQSELIARHVSKKSGFPCAPLLAERRKTATQRELGVRDRFLNALGRYEVVRGADVRKRAVLLVDDIFTTGATINECARVLRRAGAQSVFSLTMARADIKRLDKFQFLS